MRSIKLPLMGRQRPQSSCQMLGLRLLRVVRPRAAANLTEAAVSVESIGRVIKAKRVFILSLLLSGGLCPLINLTLPPCGSDAPDGAAPQRLPAAANTLFIRRGTPQRRSRQQNTRRKPCLRVRRGWTVPVHRHHQGLRPDTPRSDRHVHAAAVEVRRVKGSNAVELEKQTQQIRASPRGQ